MDACHINENEKSLILRGARVHELLASVDLAWVTCVENGHVWEAVMCGELVWNAWETGMCGVTWTEADHFLHLLRIGFSLLPGSFIVQSGSCRYFRHQLSRLSCCCLVLDSFHLLLHKGHADT